jgi:HAE1 family hydrophobic/amphiphilic exporter-1
MLSKFSVKKPYTVVVGVIIVIILGVVSYVNTSVDLLPAMNLPYIAVVTIYPGAAPEEIEKTVTKPVEEGLSAIS